jgi:hypothetical protein
LGGKSGGMAFESLMKKRRKNFYLSEDELTILKKRAEELDESMSQTLGYLIRFGILSKSVIKQIKELS